MQLQAIQNRLGIELAKQESLQGLMTSPNSYVLGTEGNVVALNLSGNGFTNDQVAFLWKEPAWQALNLSENKLTRFEGSLVMNELKDLNLSENVELHTVSFKGAMPKLEILNLSECQLKKLILPAGFDRLKKLFLHKNQLTQFVIEGKHSVVNFLDLSNNKLRDLSMPSSLPNLEYLYLQGGNQVRDIQFLSGASHLKTLNLSGTGVQDLTPLRHLLEQNVPFAWEEAGSGVLLEGCPLTIPPPEIAKEGNAALLNYFEALKDQGTDTLYEAKLLIVGEGEAGKTSLCRRLLYPEQPLPSPSESTKGIDIHRYNFPLENGREFRVNVWDFGGQEIYHATHQFFLTKRSLYILLDDTRKNHTSIHDEQFKYWLEVIDLLSGHSPVLIFQNEKAGRSKNIDIAGIKGQFDNVMDKYGGDLKEGSSITKIKKAIAYYAQKLPHIGESLPKKWISIRAELEEIAAKKPFISQGEYFKIYEKHLDFDTEKALHLSQYLHDLGVFLHYQDDLWLSQTVILQNTWATEAVFKILDDEIVKGREGKMGRFNVNDCKRLWKDSIYAGMHPQLLALMMKFELCYQLEGVKPDTWLAPQLLELSKPSSLNDWEQSGDLELRYQYDFMPKGLINRLMVRKHLFVKQLDLSWKNGVLFENEETELLARIAEKGNEVILRSRGALRKELMSSIAHELEGLHETYEGLNKKVTKRIPCNCDPCKKSSQPEYYPYSRLLKRKHNNRLEFECPESYESVSVLALLDGIQFKQKEEFQYDKYGTEVEIEGLKKEVGYLIAKKNLMAKEKIISYDVEKKFAIEIQLQDLEAKIEQKRKTLQTLADNMVGDESMKTNFQQLENSKAVSQLIQQTNKLMEDVGVMKNKFDQGVEYLDDRIEEVVVHLKGQDKSLLDILDLSRSLRVELSELFQKMDQDHYSKEELEQMSVGITQMINHNLQELPEAIGQTWQKLSKQSDSVVEIKDKFKLKIPIIPSILTYEKEVNWGLNKLVKQIWEDLKTGRVFIE